MDSASADRNATLKSLTADAGPFSPGFSPGRKQYALRVPHRVDALRLTAESAAPDARVTVIDRRQRLDADRSFC